MPKLRLDQALVMRGLVDSRSQAQSYIAEGYVTCDGHVASKASQKVDETSALCVTSRYPWVSRGGMKLAHAIEHYQLDVSGAVALDIGASTGGFTDVLLHHGAKTVYAVDVGHDQLAPTLQDDPRVVSLEGVNARHLSRTQIYEPVDVIVCDASFISLSKVLPASLALASNSATLVALIKPQFEVGKGRVGKGGVVRDTALHQEVCQNMLDWFSEYYPAWRALPVIESPIAGPDGNQEFLCVARTKDELASGHSS
jgi:23S rRNA (cytidine1920-2'-O)/16S rRNA (cytidine1409-2'-O)-methyltransferase